MELICVPEIMVDKTSGLGTAAVKCQIIRISEL